MNNDILTAFALTTIAGLSTGVGGLLSFFVKRDNTKFLSIALGFSAGVMIYVSMMEILPMAETTLSGMYGARGGAASATLAFFAGMLLIALIDRMIPKDQNPHEVHTEAEASRKGLMRTGLFTALAIGIHNFPEGLATFISALQAPLLAIPIVVAIALHNIPEGISVAIPVYYATGSRWKALYYSLLSGLAEPLGALVGYLILMPFMNDLLFGLLFAAVSGIMVFISIDELLPAARAYGEHHLSIYGVVGGMALMAVSLILFM